MDKHYRGKGSVREGVLVGGDEQQEWLLPWWWTHYKAHNDYPVAFVDFGFSSFGRHFCLERGELITVDFGAYVEEDLDPKKAARWEEIYGKYLWQVRRSWFKKPLALSHSPFEKTLWLDLDCEILGNLNSLFEKECEISVAQETANAVARDRSLGEVHEGEKLYNSGVILYQKKCCLIQEWADSVSTRFSECWSDQHLLSRLIHEKQLAFDELEPEYNWRMSQGLNLSAVIIHWVGSWGKEYIRLHGGLSPDLKRLTPWHNP